MQCCEYLFYCDYISPAAALNTKRGEGEEEKDKRNITRGYHQTMEGASESTEGGDMGKPITSQVISVWWIDAPLVFCATMHLCLLLSFEPVSVYRPNVLSCIVEIYRSSHLCNALRLIIAQFLLLNSGQKWRIWRPKKLCCTTLSRFWSVPSVSLKNIIKVIVMTSEHIWCQHWAFLQMLNQGGSSSSISSKSPINKARGLPPIH